MISLLLLICLMTLPSLGEGAGLDLHRYAVVHLGDWEAVYQGPGKDYLRDGSAGVGATNDTRLYGYSEDWLLIGYVYSTDNFRVGWVEDPRSALEFVKEADVGPLRFERVARRLKDDCAMTYDPVFVNARALDLDKGDLVTLLCYLPEKWAYVEVLTRKKLTRGFIYADMLEEEPPVPDARTLSASGGSAKTVLRSPVNKTMDGNYAVFSGPGEGYARAAGDPYIPWTNKARVYGTEDQWALIAFTGADGAEHYGWLPSRLLPNKSSVKELTFDQASASLTDDTALLDAPKDAGALTASLSAGDSVVFLCYSHKQKNWALVEYASGSRKARGFVPAARLSFD